MDKALKTVDATHTLRRYVSEWQRKNTSSFQRTVWPGYKSWPRTDAGAVTHSDRDHLQVRRIRLCHSSVSPLAPVFIFVPLFSPVCCHTNLQLQPLTLSCLLYHVDLYTVVFLLYFHYISKRNIPRHLLLHCIYWPALIICNNYKPRLTTCQ